MTDQHTSFRKQRGFTLVEAIVVMVLTGILAGIMVLFIRQPVQNYADAAGRADLTDSADLALRRMARELRTALPNSVRATADAAGVWYLQFIPTKAGGQYLAAEDNYDPAKGAALSFTDKNAKSFSVVGPMPAGAGAIVPGDLIAIYNLGNGIQDADAYVGGNVAVVSQVVQQSVTLQTNTFAVPATDPAPRLPNTSPGHRFSVIGQPVTFRCDPTTGTLARIGGNGYTANQPTPALVRHTPAQAQDTPLLAANVAGCDFSVTQAANLPTGLIGMTLVLARQRAGGANNSESVTLVHQIHVDNTP